MSAASNGGSVLDERHVLVNAYWELREEIGRPCHLPNCEHCRRLREAAAPIRDIGWPGQVRNGEWVPVRVP